MKLQSELDTALAEAVIKTVDGIDTAAGFLAAQAPDIIEQLLFWHGIKSALMFVFGIALLFTLQYLARRYIGKGPIRECGSPGGRYEQTLTHDGDGEICPRTVFTIMIGFFPVVFGIALTIGNLDWIQIIVAEKIWLLEYAAKMIK
tara:strand:+ start:40 stop:477 length:438 start_codon:yes stop_codon:yes gene_type:complete